eukprot:461137-Amphidinium_carterae.1
MKVCAVTVLASHLHVLWDLPGDILIWSPELPTSAIKILGCCGSHQGAPSLLLSRKIILLVTQRDVLNFKSWTSAALLATVG